MSPEDHARAWEAAGGDMMKRFEETRADRHLQRPLLANAALCRAVAHGYRQIARRSASAAAREVQQNG